ncbi:putative bifunctional chitinase/lysozyme [Andreprevotia sp. IGB-42]|uniref:carbohydrate-binding protein n=1 Tax=Andreprevotia sp. IGB-42 TaxID=2497473 RepID=UPI00157EF0FB|nr:carbohydrate-binding protein [Andreprevotia sp. IGB-42]KAF0813752.1 putative bifunctional chitinase/lysozyme [Andreprevotia sp. IGB-42]
MNTSLRARLYLAALPALFAASFSFAYPAWQPDTPYTAGTIVYYNGRDYKALVNQTDYTGTGWNPTVASLWQDLGPDTGGGNPTPTPTPRPNATPTPTPVSGGAGCYPAWSASTAYSGGAKVTYQGRNYTAKWWTAGEVPSASTGDGKPWLDTGPCSGTATPTPVTPTNRPPTPTPVIGNPLPGFVFGPYKDITINLDWNTNIMSTMVTGSRQPVLGVLPAGVKMVTWAFATGECGSENWGGLTPAAVASANVQRFVSAGKNYIISTGGAAGSFTCGSDAGFNKFIQNYYSANLRGIDFDIEAGQSQATIDSLVQRVINAQSTYPHLRYSFTLATLGGNSPQSLGAAGVTVMNAIRSHALSNYTINLMVMDYGSTNAGNCVISNGRCDMGASAVQAAVNLHNYYNVPYSQIELTPMIGGNDTQDETFTLADVATVTNFAKANGLAGVHYWSLDRDVDCAPGFASPTCNSYGQAGTWGFTNRFLSNGL